MQHSVLELGDLSKRNKNRNRIQVDRYTFFCSILTVHTVQQLLNQESLAQLMFD